MIVYIEKKEEGFVRGYSSSYVENFVRMDIPDDHPFFSNFLHYKVQGESLVQDLTPVVERAKSKKEKELSEQCQSCIEAGFVYSIDDTPYKFSYDLVAQLNFQANLRLLESGLEETVMWTVKYPDTLEYTRIPLTLELIKDVMNHAEQHRQIHVSKFRDFLLPIVLSSQTLEEIMEIEW